MINYFVTYPSSQSIMFKWEVTGSDNAQYTYHDTFEFSPSAKNKIFVDGALDLHAAMVELFPMYPALTNKIIPSKLDILTALKNI